MASSRLPSRTSTCPTMSGTLAAILSLLGSKKWIARLGRAGISRNGSGAPTASGRKKSLALLLDPLMAEGNQIGAGRRDEGSASAGEEFHRLTDKTHGQTMNFRRPAMIFIGQPMKLSTPTLPPTSLRGG